MSTKVVGKNDNKVQIKEIKTGKLLWKYPVDAKECVAGGGYEHVPNADPDKQVKGTAEWLNSDDGESNNNASGLPQKTNEDDNDGEDDNITLSAKIRSMNTEEITAYVEENEIDIEDFESLNLKKKRTAVLDYLYEEGDE